MLIAALALQAAVAAPAVPPRFSILTPVPNQPCVRRVPDGEVVVCGDPLPDQTLPLPDEVVSPVATPVNRDVTGIRALAAESSPCSTRVGGCQVGLDILGMGTALVRGVQKLVAPNSCCERPGEGTSTGMLVADVARGVASAFKSRPNKARRVAIDLDEPSTEGRVRP